MWRRKRRTTWASPRSSVDCARVRGYSGVGGFVGSSRGGVINNSCSTASVTGTVRIGGHLGQNSWSCDCTVGSFWNVETSGQAHSETGTPSTTAEMQIQETFLNANWDFTPKINSMDFWVIREGQGYPLSAWQIVEGDFNGDCVVDLKDFSTLAWSWGTKAEAFWNGGIDLTGNTGIDARDLCELCHRWLDRAKPILRPISLELQDRREW